jgi:mono/diheme cytochrome c family protein
MIVCLRKWGLQRILKTAHIVFLGIVAGASFAAAQDPPTPETTASIFKEKCAPCHGDDGAGTTLGNRLHVKDLRSKEVQAQSSKVLAETVSAGKGLMPAFGTRLDSGQIQKLIEYVRHMPRK